MDEYEQQQQREQMEERIRNLDQMEQAARMKIYRDSMRRQEQSTQKMFQKAMQKYGVSQAEFTRYAMEHPEETMESLYENIKGHIKRVASLGGKAKKEVRMRPANSRPARQTESRSSRGSNYEELKEKAKAGRVSDDELIDHLSQLLR